MYLGDGSLVLRYMLLISNNPNLTPGIDMTIYTIILVVSNPDVSVLFSPSHYNIFTPTRSLILLGSYFFGRISDTKIVYVINFIDFIPLMRCFIFLDFPMHCINFLYSLAPAVPQDFCVSIFLLFSRCLNYRIWPYLSSHTEFA